MKVRTTFLWLEGTSTRLTLFLVRVGPFEPGKTLAVDNSQSIDVDTVALNGGFLLKILFVAPDAYLRGLMVAPGQPALIDFVCPSRRLLSQYFR